MNNSPHPNAESHVSLPSNEGLQRIVSPRNPLIHWIVIGLILVGLIAFTRIRYHSPYLYSWDSVSFALSLENYDIRLHQPHPPGYFLYSYTLRGLNLLFNDPNTTMIFLNIISTIGACFFIFLTVLELTERKNNSILASGAALIYATNPISWFYGCIAEIYAVEGLFSSVIMYLLLSPRGSKIRMVLASVAMGIAGGFRVTTEVFLLPFYMFRLFKNDRMVVVTSLLVLFVFNAAWFLPLVSITGGLDSYLETVKNQTTRAASKTSPLMDSQEKTTANRIPLRLLQTVTIPLLLAVLFRARKVRFSKNEIYLAMILVPSLIFFFLIHYSKDGYLLLIIPALVVIFISMLSKIYKKAITLSLILVLSIVFNCIAFLQPSFIAHASQNLLSPVFSGPNQNVIRQRVNRLSQFFGAVEALKDKKRIFVLEDRHYFPNWRTVCWYFPNDTVVLSLRNQKRAYLGQNHNYGIVRPPIDVQAESWIIVVCRSRPPFEMNSFSVDGFTYYYVSARNLPSRFVLFSTSFAITGDN